MRLILILIVVFIPSFAMGAGNLDEIKRIGMKYAQCVGTYEAYKYKRKRKLGELSAAALKNSIYHISLISLVRGIPSSLLHSETFKVYEKTKHMLNSRSSREVNTRMSNCTMGFLGNNPWGPELKLLLKREAFDLPFD